MNKQLIFEYLGWDYEDYLKTVAAGLQGWEVHPLNGNDILEAVEIMEKKGDCINFHIFIYNRLPEDRLLFNYQLQNFFQLLSDWLEVRK